MEKVDPGVFGGWVTLGRQRVRGRLGPGGSWGLWGGPLVPIGCLLPSALLLLGFYFAFALLLLCFALLCFCFALLLLLLLLCFALLCFALLCFA